MLRTLIIVLTAMLLTGCSTTSSDSGFTPLFNGVNLDGWTGDTSGYIVKNGEIHSRIPEPGEHLGNLYTSEEYANFILRFDFKLTLRKLLSNTNTACLHPVEGSRIIVCESDWIWVHRSVATRVA